MAAMTLNFSLECVIQYYTDQRLNSFYSRICQQNMYTEISASYPASPINNEVSHWRGKREGVSGKLPSLHPHISLNITSAWAKSRDYKERQVDRKKRKVFVTAHVILRTTAMFLASALNRGSQPSEI